MKAANRTVGGLYSMFVKGGVEGNTIGSSSTGSSSSSAAARRRGGVAGGRLQLEARDQGGAAAAHRRPQGEGAAEGGARRVRAPRRGRAGGGGAQRERAAEDVQGEAEEDRRRGCGEEIGEIKMNISVRRRPRTERPPTRDGELGRRSRSSGTSAVVDDAARQLTPCLARLPMRRILLALASPLRPCTRSSCPPSSTRTLSPTQLRGEPSALRRPLSAGDASARAYPRRARSPRRWEPTPPPRRARADGGRARAVVGRRRNGSAGARHHGADPAALLAVAPAFRASGRSRSSAASRSRSCRRCVAHAARVPRGGGGLLPRVLRDGGDDVNGSGARRRR